MKATRSEREKEAESNKENGTEVGHEKVKGQVEENIYMRRK